MIWLRSKIRELGSFAPSVLMNISRFLLNHDYVAFNLSFSADRDAPRWVNVSFIQCTIAMNEIYNRNRNAFVHCGKEMKFCNGNSLRLIASSRLPHPTRLWLKRSCLMCMQRVHRAVSGILSITRFQIGWVFNMHFRTYLPRTFVFQFVVHRKRVYTRKQASGTVSIARFDLWPNILRVHCVHFSVRSSLCGLRVGMVLLPLQWTKSIQRILPIRLCCRCCCPRPIAMANVCSISVRFSICFNNYASAYRTRLQLAITSTQSFECIRRVLRTNLFTPPSLDCFVFPKMFYKIIKI